MSPPTLPLEIWTLISENFEHDPLRHMSSQIHPPLKTCALVSRTCYRAAAPILWRTVILDPGQIGAEDVGMLSQMLAHTKRLTVRSLHADDSVALAYSDVVSLSGHATPEESSENASGEAGIENLDEVHFEDDSTIKPEIVTFELEYMPPSASRSASESTSLTNIIAAMKLAKNQQLSALVLKNLVLEDARDILLLLGAAPALLELSVISVTEHAQTNVPNLILACSWSSGRDNIPLPAITHLTIDASELWPLERLLCEAWAGSLRSITCTLYGSGWSSRRRGSDGWNYHHHIAKLLDLSECRITQLRLHLRNERISSEYSSL
jgi:hypothetical protein